MKPMDWLVPNLYCLLLSYEIIERRLRMDERKSGYSFENASQKDTMYGDCWTTIE
jgi:hypothetical protein